MDYSINQGCPDLGLMTWLGFHGYTRISELADIRRTGYVPQPRGQGLRTFATVILSTTKAGRAQSFEVLNEGLDYAMQQYISSRTRPGRSLARPDHLFDHTSAQYREWLTAACKECGLHSVHLSPHSLRGGGATADQLRGVEKKEIQARGRWESERTCGLYLQSARVLTESITISLALKQLGLALYDQGNMGHMFWGVF